MSVDPEPTTAGKRSQTARDFLWIGCMVLLFVAGVTYGFWSFGTLVSEVDERCAHGFVYDGAPMVEMREGLVPLEHTCVFEDGTTYETVPALVNFLAFGGLAGAVVCAGTALWLRHIARTERWPYGRSWPTGGT